MTPPVAPEASGATAPAPRGKFRQVVRGGVRVILLSCFTALVFILALAITMPASALRRIIDLPDQVTDLRGTLWRGSAILTDGYALRWDGDLAALILARVSADVTLTGADTQLDGTLTFGLRSMALRDLAGRAGPGLLALAPGLPVDGCTLRAVVDVPLARLQPGAAAAEGQIGIDAGTCEDFAGNVITIPALTLTLQSAGNDALAVLTQGETVLGQVTVAGDRRFIIRVEPDGAALVPGMPRSGPTILEYPF